MVLMLMWLLLLYYHCCDCYFRLLLKKSKQEGSLRDRSVDADVDAAFFALAEDGSLLSPVSPPIGVVVVVP